MLSTNEKYELITRNLKEIVGDPEEIKKIIDNRSLKIYWGTAPTGKIHVGYFVPLLKIADFLLADCEVTILIADLHAYLDSMKSSLEQLKFRTEYYILMIKEMLKLLNVNISKLKFVKGTDFQMTNKYTMDVYKFCSIVSLSDSKHAGAEVVKQTDNPKINGLLYPMLQCLDEEYLDVDVQFGGCDQRKLFMLARKFLPKLGYKKRFHFMNEMVPGLKTEKNNYNKLKDSINDIVNNSNDEKKLLINLEKLVNLHNSNTSNIQNEKMSSSNLNSKIDILDSNNQVKKKINRSYCLPSNIDDNTPLTLLEKVIMPILKHKKLKFIVNRNEEYGGNVEYDNIDKLKDDFKNEKLHPGDLKINIVNMINNILSPIKKTFSIEDNVKLVKLAYDDKFLKKYLNNSKI